MGMPPSLAVVIKTSETIGRKSVSDSDRTSLSVLKLLVSTLSLLDQLRALRRHIRRLLWLTGLSWVLAGLLAGLLLSGLADWFWRFDALSPRLLLSAFWLGMVSWIAWKRLIAPLRSPLTPVELSGHLEHRFPQLRGQLTSAVEFLARGASSEVGSPELQQRLIDRTTAEVRVLDVTDVLDRREMSRASAVLAAITIVCTLLAATNLSAAITAMKRLLWPFGEHPWPQQVELLLVRSDLSPVRWEAGQPLRSGQGQPLDLFVVNALGDLPQPVLVEYRWSKHLSPPEVMRTVTLHDSSGQPKPAAAIRLPIEEGEFEFRATGGDDQHMPWHTVQITPLVKVDAWTMQVTPPEYLAQAVTAVPEGATQVRAVLGSRIRVTVKTSRPVKAATWRDGLNEPRSLVVQSAAPRLLETDLVVSQPDSVTHRLSLTDADGFENPTALRVEIIGIVDPPPEVTLEEPATDQLATPTAVIPIVAKVRDDVRIREIRLEHQIHSETEPSELSWKSEILESASPSAEVVTRLAWPIAKWNPEPGDRVTVRVAATDHCDVGEPRVGRSLARTLTIVSPEAKRAEIAHRLDLLLHDLESLATNQSRVLEQTQPLRVQVEKTGELRPQDRDTLKRVDLDQRQIDAGITNPHDGIARRTLDLLQQHDLNQLQDHVTRERLTSIALACDSLNDAALPLLRSELGRLVKTLADSDAAMSEAFAAVVAQQQVVLSTLQNLVRDLTQWRDRRELARELAELAGAQDAIHRDTQELAPRTLGKTTSQLPLQLQAELSKLADRQARQAERIEQLRQRLRNQITDSSDSVASSTQSSDDNARAQAQLLQEFDKRALVARSRDASQLVESNNLGQAGAAQRQLTEELRTLAEQFRQSPMDGGEDRLRELNDLGQRANELARQQRELLAATKTAEKTADSQPPQELAQRAQTLRDQQTTTRQATAELATRLQNSAAVDRNEELSRALRRAIRQMQQAERELNERQFARGAQHEQTALDDLELASRELASAARDAQQARLADQTRELLQSLQELTARQKIAIEATRQLTDEFQKAGKWTRPLLKAAVSLSNDEQELADAVRKLNELGPDIAAIRRTLQLASDDLSAASTRLREKQLDEETHRREASALSHLLALTNALDDRSSSPNPASQEPMPQNADQKSAPANDDPVPPVAQLKLLRHLQSEIADRTQAADQTPNASRRDSEIKRLADDQTSLLEALTCLFDRVPVSSGNSDQEPSSKEPSAEFTLRKNSLAAMQKSATKLEALDAGKETQSVQRTALDSLDTLLKQWEQRAAQQQALDRSKSPSSNTKNGEQAPSAVNDGTGGKPTGRDTSKAEESSHRDRTGTDVEAELRRQRRLREAVWGHLPPALREQMLNLPHDKSLPKYTDHIRRYYEALAEQD